MTALQTELAHLVALMAPPYREAWKAYCWTKAGVLAESNPTDYAELPRLLKEAMQSKPAKDMPIATAASP